MLALHRAGRQAEALRRARSSADPPRRARPGGVAVARELERPDAGRRPGAAAGATRRRGGPRGGGRRRPDALVGRDPDLASMATLVPRGGPSPLIGPVGVGKTRLACRSPPTRGRGRHVTMVELAAVGDPSAVAEAVGDRPRRAATPVGGVEDALMDVLRTSDQLMVLDNCEHVIEAVGALVGWLTAVVSEPRSPHHLAEHSVCRARWWTPSNHCGSPTTSRRTTSLHRRRCNCSASVRQRRDPGSPPPPSCWRPSTRLCRRLDGLPLALELAAARIRSLGPEAMVERLDQRFRLLDAGPHRGEPAPPDARRPGRLVLRAADRRGAVGVHLPLGVRRRLRPAGRRGGVR